MEIDTDKLSKMFTVMLDAAHVVTKCAIPVLNRVLMQIMHLIMVSKSISNAQNVRLIISFLGVRF